MLTEIQLHRATRLVGQLRTMPDVQRFFNDRNRQMPSTAGDFLRALMPDMLTDSEVVTLASECGSAMVFMAARAILNEEADRIEYRHDSLADVRRSVPVLEKVYA